MSTATHRLPLAKADGLARKIVKTLGPACDRIEVAGSIRRRERTIGDIEIVAIPIRQPGLFGQPDQSVLDVTLERLASADRLHRGRIEGDRQKNFLIPAVEGLSLDLFIVTPETWGVQMAIRTGPAEFSKRLVTHESYGGLLPDDLRIAKGRVWKIAARDDSQAKPLRTPEERDVFELLRCGWIQPEYRH